MATSYTFTSIAVPGANFTGANGINASGDVVGDYSDSTGVHGFLDDVGIAYCGRYGDWAYLWTDESFISGERAAETALGSLALPQRLGVPA